MTKLTIDSEDFYNLAQCYRHIPIVEQSKVVDAYNEMLSHIDAKLKEAYELGKRDATTWIEVSDRLPELGIERSVRALVETSNSHVYEMTYTSNVYAKTEKGRAPRWEHHWRLPMYEVVRWKPMPLPKEPT